MLKPRNKPYINTLQVIAESHSDSNNTELKQSIFSKQDAELLTQNLNLDTFGIAYSNTELKQSILSKQDAELLTQNLNLNTFGIAYSNTEFHSDGI